MSKRSSKRRRASARRKARRGGRQRERQVVQPRAAAERRAPVAKVENKVDFREEYHYVLTDLKRIGILAAAMLAVLIALSFLLP